MNNTYLREIVNNSHNGNKGQGHSDGELDVRAQVLHDHAVVCSRHCGVTVTPLLAGVWGDHYLLPGTVLDLEGGREP